MASRGEAPGSRDNFLEAVTARWGEVKLHSDGERREAEKLFLQHTYGKEDPSTPAELAKALTDELKHADAKGEVRYQRLAALWAAVGMRADAEGPQQRQIVRMHSEMEDAVQVCLTSRLYGGGPQGYYDILRGELMERQPTLFGLRIAIDSQRWGRKHTGGGRNLRGGVSTVAQSNTAQKVSDAARVGVTASMSALTRGAILGAAHIVNKISHNKVGDVSAVAKRSGQWVGDKAGNVVDLTTKFGRATADAPWLTGGAQKIRSDLRAGLDHLVSDSEFEVKSGDPHLLTKAEEEWVDRMATVGLNANDLLRHHYSSVRVDDLARYISVCGSLEAARKAEQAEGGAPSGSRPAARKSSGHGMTTGSDGLPMTMYEAALHVRDAASSIRGNQADIDLALNKLAALPGLSPGEWTPEHGYVPNPSRTAPVGPTSRTVHMPNTRSTTPALEGEVRTTRLTDVLGGVNSQKGRQLDQAFTPGQDAKQEAIRAADETYDAIVGGALDGTKPVDLRDRTPAQAALVLAGVQERSRATGAPAPEIVYSPVLKQQIYDEVIKPHLPAIAAGQPVPKALDDLALGILDPKHGSDSVHPYDPNDPMYAVPGGDRRRQADLQEMRDLAEAYRRRNIRHFGPEAGYSPLDDDFDNFFLTARAVSFDEVRNEPDGSPLQQTRAHAVIEAFPVGGHTVASPVYTTYREARDVVDRGWDREPTVFLSPDGSHPDSTATRVSGAAGSLVMEPQVETYGEAPAGGNGNGNGSASAPQPAGLSFGGSYTPSQDRNPSEVRVVEVTETPPVATSESAPAPAPVQSPPAASPEATTDPSERVAAVLSPRSNAQVWAAAYDSLISHPSPALRKTMDGLKPSLLPKASRRELKDIDPLLAASAQLRLAAQERKGQVRDAHGNVYPEVAAAAERVLAAHEARGAGRPVPRGLSVVISQAQRIATFPTVYRP